MRLALTALLFVACTSTQDSDSDSDSEGDTETDTEADTEPDSDTDMATGAECGNTDLITLPFTYSGSDWSADHSLTSDYVSGAGCMPPNQTVAAGSKRLELDVAAGDVLVIEETGTADSLWFVVDGCQAGDACAVVHDDADEDGRFTFPTGGHWLLVLSSWGANDPGDYSFSIDLEDPEDCTNGVDDNNDGLADCADPACDQEATCECTSTTIEWSSNLYVAGADLTNQAEFTGAGCPSGSGPSLVIEFSADAGDEFVFAENAPRGADMFVMQACASDAACVAVNTTDEFGAIVDYTIPTSGTYYAVMRPHDAQPDAFYTYSAYIPDPEDCATDDDEDFDGYAGCSDDDCAGTLRCFMCGEVETSGFSWSESFEFAPDPFDFAPTGGCEDGSSGGGNDIVVAFELLAGSGIQITETGPVDVIVNITAGEDQCTPELSNNTCVYSGDDPNGSDDNPHRFVAPTTGVYNVILSTYYDEPVDPEFNLQFEIFEPEDCSSNVDEDLDGFTSCDDTDCDGHPACDIDCGDPQPPNVIRVAAGSNFAANYPDDVAYVSDNGCLFNRGSDAIFPVFAEAGDIITTVETGAMDAVVNITFGEGACDEAVSNNVCVYSNDDAPGAVDHHERIYVATETGIHNVIVTSFGAVDTRSYDIAVSVETPVEAEECSTIEDEDGDGEGMCADDDCDSANSCIACERRDPLTTSVNGNSFSGWWDLFALDELHFTNANGCQASASGSSPLEAVHPVYLQVGQFLMVYDRTDNTANNMDLVVNITRGACRQEDALECVYGEDTPAQPGTNDERFGYAATEEGWHYVTVTTWTRVTDVPFSYRIDVEEAPLGN